MENSQWTGSAWGILGWRIVITIASMLFLVPLAFVIPKYNKWFYSKMTIDGKQLEFREDGPWFGFIGWMLFSIITLGLGSWYASKKMHQWTIKRVHVNGEEGSSYWTGSAAGILGYGVLQALSIYLFFIPFLFVIVVVEKWYTKNTYIDGKQFEFRYEGAYWEMIGWIFLVVITLGLASFFVEKKITQWSVENTHFISSLKTSF